jgi:hypothetical protein
MSLWRWLRDDELKFPKPVRVRGRKYFRPRTWRRGKPSEPGRGRGDRWKLEPPPELALRAAAGLSLYGKKDGYALVQSAADMFVASELPMPSS